MLIAYHRRTQVVGATEAARALTISLAALSSSGGVSRPNVSQVPKGSAMVCFFA